MKKTITILTMFFLLIIAGCSNDDKDENNENNSSVCTQGNSWNEGCNTCRCDNNEVICTNKDCNIKNDSFIDDFNEKLDLVKFNSNLSKEEAYYLNIYQNKYPNSRIYFMKTKTFNCEGCYEIYYKKDREILRVKILDYKISQESVITNELNLYIDNSNMCKLFQGTWNECPKLCPTDEEICVTQCGTATCEFDETKIIWKKNGDICGGLDMGDCEYGFTCSYKSEQDEYGTCIKK